MAAAAVLVALLGLALALRGGGDDGSNAAPPTVTTTAPATTGTTEPGETETTGTTATGTTTDTASAPPYALAPTRRCLVSAGAVVSTIRSSDPRLRALGDLAQRTSLEVRLDGRTLGLAFGDARLLESLMRVPDDPYRLEVRRNALLMYRPGARRAAAVLRGCLRS